MDLSIGELAARTGEAVATLRYWTDRGLLPAERGENRYRYYRPEAAERASFIRNAQALGFTLDRIGEVLDLREGGRKPCREVRVGLAAHLAGLRERLAEMHALEAELASRLAWAEANPDPECDERDGCAYLAPGVSGPA